MNALATIEAAAPPAAFGEWVATGRALLTERTNLEWRLADWIADGRDQFGHHAQLDFLADQLGIAPKTLRTAANVARAFPPSQRAKAVAYEVHAYIAVLPGEQRLSVLKRAETERWGEREAKAAVVTHRQQAAMFDDEDSDTRLAVEIIRAWNRAPVESRRYAYELMNAATFAAIDEDRP